MTDDTIDTLSEKHRVFVYAYLETGSASKAAKHAGFKPRDAGRLLARADIKDEIARREQQSGSENPAPANASTMPPLLREAYAALRMAAENGNPMHMSACIKTIADLEAAAKPAVDPSSTD